MNKETKIMSGVAVLVIAAAAFILFRTPSNPVATKPVETNSLLREGSHMTGNKNAKVTVVEFGDYQCPACAAEQPVVEQLIEAYKDNKDFNFVFRNFPLSQHQYARLTANVAEAAGVQGKYWEMNQKLYATQNVWSVSNNAFDLFLGYAKDLGLNVDQLKSEAQENRYTDIIDADYSDGVNAGVNATPTFFINGEKQPNIPTLEQFKAIIDQKLK